MSRASITCENGLRKVRKQETFYLKALAVGRSAEIRHLASQAASSRNFSFFIKYLLIRTVAVKDGLGVLCARAESEDLKDRGTNASANYFTPASPQLSFFAC
jgi:hypothetical protein